MGEGGTTFLCLTISCKCLTFHPNEFWVGCCCHGDFSGAPTLHPGDCCKLSLALLCCATNNKTTTTTTTSFKSNEYFSKLQQFLSRKPNKKYIKLRHPAAQPTRFWGMHEYSKLLMLTFTNKSKTKFVSWFWSLKMWIMNHIF